MEGKCYHTRIRNDHPAYGKNPYVRGVVMGIMSTTVGDGLINGLVGPGDVNAETGERTLNVVTTEELYRLFAERVEKLYPGLCEFNCEKPVDER